MKEKQMLTTNNQSSIDYLYKVCREHPLLVISTPHGVGKYHFNCIGHKNSKVLLEFILIIDHNFKDSDVISTELGNKYYLTINQFLLAYKNLAFA